MHPDRSFVEKVLQIITTAADIRYRGPIFPRFTANPFSARKTSAALRKQITAEVLLTIRSDYPPRLFPNSVVSPLGVLPKPSGKIKIVMDLRRSEWV